MGPDDRGTTLSGPTQPTEPSRDEPLHLGDDDLEAAARVAADALVDKLADDVVVLQVGPVLAVAEQFVIASGRNPRQVKALVEEVEARIGDELDRKPIRIEGNAENRWVLMDYGEVVVHVFDDEVRRFYELERLWSDVPIWRPVVDDHRTP